MRPTLATLVFTALFPALALPTAADAAGSAERGAYLVRIMDCGGCHTPRQPDGQPVETLALSGGTVGFEIPGLGVFWPPNLTNDATGLAGWSDAEIVAAVRDGTRPDGRQLAPAMPWMSYAVLSDGDAADLVAYLRSLTGIANPVPAPTGSGAEAQMPFYSVVVPAVPKG